MMSKMQKIWLSIFAAMFLIPEILFFTTLSLVSSINGKSFYDISSPVANYSIFFSHPFYLLFIIAIELLGVFGLIIFCLKSNRKLFAIIPFVISLWLLFIFVVVYVTGVSMGS